MCSGAWASAREQGLCAKHAEFWQNFRTSINKACTCVYICTHIHMYTHICIHTHIPEQDVQIRNLNVGLSYFWISLIEIREYMPCGRYTVSPGHLEVFDWSHMCCTNYLNIHSLHIQNAQDLVGTHRGYYSGIS